MIKYKFSQVGLTLSWFAAFIVIVFILALYIFFVSALASHRVVPDLILNEILGKDSIEKTRGVGSFESQQELSYLLNYPIDNGDLEDLLIRYNKDNTLKENVERNALSILESIKEDNECFILNVGNSISLRSDNFRSETKDFIEMLGDAVVTKIPEKGGNEIKFYFGKC
jgi:hypothetical protein